MKRNLRYNSAFTVNLNFANLGINNPAEEPGAHFTAYTAVSTSASAYTIEARHNSDPNVNYLVLTYDRLANPAIVIRGNGIFSSINIDSDT